MFDPNKDIQEQVIAKAKEDPEFKQLILTNPKAALEQEIGQSIPTDLEIKVVQQTKNKLYMVLPLEQDQVQAQELSDKELEAVSGGTTLLCGAVIAVTAGLCSRTWPCRR